MNDIALIKLKESVDLDEYIQVACLPDPKWSSHYPPNVPGWVIGNRSNILSKKNLFFKKRCSKPLYSKAGAQQKRVVRRPTRLRMCALMCMRTKCATKCSTSRKTMRHKFVQAT